MALSDYTVSELIDLHFIIGFAADQPMTMESGKLGDLSAVKFWAKEVSKELARRNDRQIEEQKDIDFEKRRNAIMQ